MTDDMDRDTSGGPLGADQDEDTADDRGGIGERVDEFIHGKDEPGVGGGGDWDLGGTGTGEPRADLGDKLDLGGSGEIGDNTGATGDLDMGGRDRS